MATRQPDDLEFLTQVITLTDQDPINPPNGRTVGHAIGLRDETVIETTVRRLKSRGLLDWAPGPRRYGHDWTNTPLAVTPKGYRFDHTGLNR